MLSNFELSYSTIPSAGGGVAFYILCAQSVEDPSLLFKGPQEKLDSLNRRLTAIGLSVSRLQDATERPPVAPILVSHEDVQKLAIRLLP
jgi:hypothetical protein